jgi:hypothetical protein
MMLIIQINCSLYKLKEVKERERERGREEQIKGVRDECRRE